MTVLGDGLWMILFSFFSEDLEGPILLLKSITALHTLAVPLPLSLCTICLSLEHHSHSWSESRDLRFAGLVYHVG